MGDKHSRIMWTTYCACHLQLNRSNCNRVESGSIVVNPILSNIFSKIHQQGSKISSRFLVAPIRPSSDSRMNLFVNEGILKYVKAAQSKQITPTNKWQETVAEAIEDKLIRAKLQFFKGIAAGPASTISFLSILTSLSYSSL